MNKAELKEKIDQGGLVSNAILEVLGKPDKYVEESLKKFVDKIKADSSFEILNEDFHPVEPQKEGLFSAFVELKIFAKDMNSMIGFCFDYMPSSIDVVEPSNIKFDSKVVSDFLNDLMARLHQVDQVARNASAQGKFDRRNMILIVRYSILYNLKQGDKTAEELRSCTGITMENLQQYLDTMEKGNIIKKEGDKYSITDKVKFNEQ